MGTVIKFIKPTANGDDIPQAAKTLLKFCHFDDWKRPIRANAHWEWATIESRLKLYSVADTNAGDPWIAVQGVNYVGLPPSLDGRRLCGPCGILQINCGLIVVDRDTPWEPEEFVKFAALQGIKYSYERYLEIHDIFWNAFERRFPGAYKVKSCSGSGWHYWIAAQNQYANISLAFHLGDVLAIGATYESGDDAQWVGGVKSELTPGYHQTAYDEWKALLERDNMMSMAKPRDGEDMGMSEDLGRRIDLTDDQVIGCIRGTGVDKNCYARLMNERSTWFSGDWSEDFKKIVGEFDKVTGDPEQILRIIDQTPFARESGVNNEGEERYEKVHRTFYSTLINCRKQLPAFYEHRPDRDPRKNPLMNHIARQENVSRMQKMMQGIAWVSAAQAADEASKRAEPTPVASPEAVAAAVEHIAEFVAAEAVRMDVVVDEKYDTTPACLFAYPPGLLGSIARDHFAMSDYPNQSLSVMFALAVGCAFTQRSYHCSGNAMNQYMVALMGTGEGKETLPRLMAVLFNQITQSDGMFSQTQYNLLGPGSYASGIAFYKQFNVQPRILSIMNEIGYMFGNMGEKGNKHGEDIKKAILDLKTKSAPGSVLRTHVHSDKRNNTEACQMPSLSILGESQPHRFYISLTPQLLIDGLPQRWFIGDCSRAHKGRRIPYDQKRHVFSNETIEGLRAVARVVDGVEHKHSRVPVLITVPLSFEAAKLFAKFEAFIERMNTADTPYEYLLYNRAIATGLSLGGMIAAMENPLSPEVSQEIAQYTLDLVYKERQFLVQKFKDNEVGETQERQIAGVTDAMYAMLVCKHQKITTEMKLNGIVPMWWITDKITHTSSLAVLFNDDNRRTLQQKIDDALMTMIKRGMIQKWYPDARQNYTVITKGETYQMIDIDPHRKKRR